MPPERNDSFADIRSGCPFSPWRCSSSCRWPGERHQLDHARRPDARRI